MKYNGIGDFSAAGLLIHPTYATTGALPTAAAGNRGSTAFVQADNGIYLSNGSAWGILGSKWTDGGSTTYLTATGDNVSIGSTAAAYKLDVTGDVAIGAADAYYFGNVKLAYGKSANHNYFFGAAGNGSTGIGVKNIGIGTSALSSFTAGHFNIAIGFEAGKLIQDGQGNVAIGSQALSANVSGNNNFALGSEALKIATVSANVAVGGLSMQQTTTGSGNVGVGYYTLNSNTIGGSNVAIGSTALQNNQDGGSNVAIGEAALISNVSGVNNVSVGRESMYPATGSNNTCLGRQAGVNLTTGSRNILIGSTIHAPSASGSNQLAIGNLIFGTSVDGTGTTISSGKIGIANNSPTSRFEVTNNGLGTTQDSAAGIAITNNTAASAGAQQISPAVRWTGQGWKTNATAASRTVDFRAYVIPVEGAANPTVTWIMECQVNGAGYFGIMSMNSKEQVGVGVQNPDASAVLEVKSTAMGFLPPRMTTAQKNAIASPANGLILYDTDLAKIAARQGGAWTLMGTIAGTLAITQVGFGTGTDTIGGNAAFVWDNTNSRLGVNKTGPTRTLHVGGVVFAEGGILESQGTGVVASVNTAAGIRLINTTGGTGIVWGIGSENSGDLHFYPDTTTATFGLSNANWGAAVGGGANCYLWGMLSVSGGGFSDSNCQSSTLTERNDITGTAATEIYLDGAGTRPILSGNRVWTGFIYIHARIKTQGNGSLIANTFYSHTFKFAIERNGATTTLLGQEAIGTAFATGGFAPTISITADDTNESLKITYAVGAGGGSTTVSRVSATIHFNDVQF